MSVVAHEARQLLSAGSIGLLSTHSAEMQGYPFGSLVQYCLDVQGHPIILISALAEHTRNLLASPHCSLLVVQGGEEPLANARLTLLADATQLPSDQVEIVAERFYRLFPKMRDFHRTLDFCFYRLSVVRIRYIAGFAKVHWISPEAFHS